MTNSMHSFRRIAAFLLVALSFQTASAQFTARSPRLETFGGAPAYTIVDIGVVQQTDSASQGFRVSSGGVGVGRSIRTGNAQAFTWTQASGIIGLPLLAGRAFCVANGANDSGITVGTCANTLFGTARLPVIWQNGTATQLPMPQGETLGDANDVNSSGVVVGSVNSGSLQKAVYYSGGTATFISQTTSGGAFFVTAFSINDAGTIVGQGIDPANAARNVGMVYDIGAGTATEVGSLPSGNGALAFDIGNAGHVVGSAMLNQGSGTPFIWTQSGGMTAIPLPAGTTQGSARGVNSNGWAVGTASSAFAIPFLYDGSATYRLADLIPAGTGWDLSTNTSSAALGISDGNVIVGTGVLNGAVHAFAMIPASSATISGRVLESNGTGVRRMTVTLSGGSLPNPIVATTSSFGWFAFPAVPANAQYTVTLETSRSKLTFAQTSQQVTPTGDVSNVDFVANP